MSEKDEVNKIEKKIFEMIDYGYTAMRQYPKSEKFALAADIKRCMDQVLEKPIEAKKKYFKKTTLQDMDVELEKVRKYVRLSYHLGFLPMQKYDTWSEKIDEVGKILGAWIKSNNAKFNSPTGNRA